MKKSLRRLQIQQKEQEQALRSRTEAGIRTVDKMLGIDSADYQTIDTNELKSRIDKRMKEQDEVIFPKRANEGNITPEWRRYAEKRRLL